MNFSAQSTGTRAKVRKPLALSRLGASLTAATTTATRPWQRMPLLQQVLQVLTVDSSLRRTYAHSRKLLRGSPSPEKVVAAAHLFQIRGLYDEAVGILLHFRLADQAAKLMLQQGMPDRAGVIYAHASLWERAASCFGQAKLWKKAANCCVCSRDFTTAAVYFAKGGDFGEAAQCCIKAGDMAGALRFYGALGDLGQASAVLKNWRLHAREDSIQSKLTPADRELIAKISARSKKPGQHTEELATSDLVAHAHAASKFVLGGDTESSVQAEKSAAPSALASVSTAPRPVARPSQADSSAHAAAQPGGTSGAAPAGDAKQRALAMVASMAVHTERGGVLMSSPAAVPLDPAGEEGDTGEYRPSWLDTPTLVAPLGGGRLDVADFFQRFTRSDRDKLWRLGKVIEVTEGSVVVDYDEEPPGLFTVLDGNLNIFRDRCSETPADQIGAKVSFGQFWAVMRLRSHVRVTATKSCKVHMISRADLVKALRMTDQTHLALRQMFMSVLLEHLVSSILVKNV